MTSVNVQAQFKKAEREFNGLGAVAADMIAKPHERIVVVAVLEVTKLTTDVADDEITPTVNIKLVEVMDTETDMAAAKALLDARYARRTGRAGAPETLFDVDPNAPEMAGPPVLPSGDDPL